MVALSINDFYMPLFNSSFISQHREDNYTAPNFSIFDTYMRSPVSIYDFYMPIWNTSFWDFGSFWDIPLFTFSSFSNRRKVTAQKSKGTYSNKTEQLTNYTQQPEYLDSNKGNQLINYAQQYVNKTSAQMSQIMRQKGYSFHSGAWCADFVNFVVGTSMGNNSPDWYRNIRNKSWVGNVVKAARPVGRVVAERKGGKIDFSNVRPGDIIIFDWEGNSYATRNDDKTDHIGLVKEVNGNSITTIEGNNGGKVSQITYTPNGRGCFSNTRSIHSIIRLA